MREKVNDRPPSRHRVITEIHPQMAKADLRKAESEDSLKELGECLDFARRVVGWNLEQLAANMPPPPGSEKRDPRQVQRWIEGKERTQVDTVFDVVALRVPFVIALARLTVECVEETTLRFQRRA